MTVTSDCNAPHYTRCDTTPGRTAPPHISIHNALQQASTPTIEGRNGSPQTATSHSLKSTGFTFCLFDPLGFPFFEAALCIDKHRLRHLAPLHLSPHSWLDSYRSTLTMRGATS